MADTPRLTRSRPGFVSLAAAVRTVAVLLIVALAAAACGADVPTVRPSTARPSASSGVAAPGASSTTGDSNLMPCKAADLNALISAWTGTPTSRVAEVVVTAKSDVVCTVRGKPGVRLLNGKGKLLLDSAKIAGVGGPKVKSTDPVVVVAPGDGVTLDVQWLNWCQAQPTRPLTVALVLTDRGGLLKAAKARKSGNDDAPKCTVKAKSSILRVTHVWTGPGL